MRRHIFGCVAAAVLFSGAAQAAPEVCVANGEGYQPFADLISSLVSDVLGVEEIPVRTVTHRLEAAECLKNPDAVSLLPGSMIAAAYASLPKDATAAFAVTRIVTYVPIVAAVRPGSDGMVNLELTTVHLAVVRGLAADTVAALMQDDPRLERLRIAQVENADQALLKVAAGTATAALLMEPPYSVNVHYEAAHRRGLAMVPTTVPGMQDRMIPNTTVPVFGVCQNIVIGGQKEPLTTACTPLVLIVHPNAAKLSEALEELGPEEFLPESGIATEALSLLETAGTIVPDLFELLLLLSF